MNERIEKIWCFMFFQAIVFIICLLAIMIAVSIDINNIKDDVKALQENK